MTACEHPVVRRARFSVSKVNELQHKLHLAHAELENAKLDMRRKLVEMQQSGQPDEPWAKHWRVALDME